MVFQWFTWASCTHTLCPCALLRRDPRRKRQIRKVCVLAPVRHQLLLIQPHSLASPWGSLLVSGESLRLCGTGVPPAG